MSNISYCFRDLESSREGPRNSAALLILAENFDDLRKPGTYQSQKFEELFIPIFKKVARKTKRQATLLLAHHRYVPVNVCEFLALQPLDISAPFLSHSPSLSNPALCYILARTNEHYGRIIAGRRSLSKRVVQSLLAINDDQINHLLQVRGYIKNTGEKQNKTMSDPGELLTPVVVKPVGQEHLNIPIDAEPVKDKPVKDEKFTGEPVKAEEILRQTLRDLAQGNLTPEDISPVKASHAKTRHAESLPVHLDKETHNRHINIIGKHIKNNHLEYFKTSIADAIGSSMKLAERIMDDMSGRHLAITLKAIRAPEDISLKALNKFFPHVSIMEGTEEGAREMLGNLEYHACLQHLTVWLETDIESVSHVDMSKTDIDYTRLDIADMPYVNPVADNNDSLPSGESLPSGGSVPSGDRHDKTGILDKEPLKAIG